MFLLLKHKLYIIASICTIKTNALILKEVIDMKRKSFGIKGKSASMKKKQETFKPIRLMVILSKMGSYISWPVPMSPITPSESVNLNTNHSLEAYLKRGQGLAHQRMEENRPR